MIDKEYQTKLHKLVKSLDLDNDVKFIGAKTERELAIEYSESAVFVLPSERESFGIVAVEAMASKTPVIASNVGGLPEIITDGKEGYLIECGNVEQLTKSIIELKLII